MMKLRIDAGVLGVSGYLFPQGFVVDLRPFDNPSICLNFLASIMLILEAVDLATNVASLTLAQVTHEGLHL